MCVSAAAHSLVEILSSKAGCIEHHVVVCCWWCCLCVCHTVLYVRRRVFPAVPAGVIEDVKFVGSSRLVCAYYGGVVLHSTQPGGFGVQLE